MLWLIKKTAYVIYEWTLSGRVHDHSENPYEILDHYVQAAYKTTKTGSATNKSSPEQEIKQLKVL